MIPDKIFRTSGAKNDTGFSVMQFSKSVTTKNESNTKTYMYMENRLLHFVPNIPTDFLVRFLFYIWEMKAILKAPYP